jgi:glycosyltransferase involved in cell wall biosynthesis
LGPLVDLVVDESVPRRGLGRRPPRVDCWLADGHANALDTKAPIVAVVHEASWNEPETRASAAPAFLEAIAARTAANVATARRILACSQHAKRQIQNVYAVPDDMVTVVPYGVDAAVFRPGLSDGAARVASASGTRAPYVLFAGTVFPRKNLPVLRAAMQRIAADGLPHLLVLVVTPAADRADSRSLYAEAVGDLASAPGRVVVLDAPRDEDLASLMAGSAALCLPSLSEGFGLTALEAMACGAVVVASARGALPEVVGDAGLLVQPTVDGVYDGLRRAIVDTRQAQELRRRARLRAESMTWRHTAQGWLATLAAVA